MPEVLRYWKPVYKEVMSIVKISLFSPEKLKSRKVSHAWLVSLMYDGKDLAIGTIILSKYLEMSSVGQLRAETIGHETGRIFSQPPLISFERNKNIGNFLVRSVLKSDDQPGTFKYARKRCNHLTFHSQCGQNNRTQTID